MQQRYQRNLGALTPEECERLNGSHVCVVGCGGLGGYIIEFLARVGVGSLTVVDGDVFDETNFNRQLLSKEALIGHGKAAAAAEHVAEINSTVNVRAVSEFLTNDNAEAILGGCDLAVDALDSIAARRLLASACAKQGIPMIHGAVRGWNAQISVIPPREGAIDALYTKQMKQPSAPTPCLAFTPALAAAIEAAEAVKVLLGRSPDLTGKLLLIDLMTHGCNIVEL